MIAADGTSELARGHEAAHSHRRVIHAGGDATGLAIEVALLRAVRALAVEVHEHTFMRDLVVVRGRGRRARSPGSTSSARTAPTSASTPTSSCSRAGEPASSTATPRTRRSRPATASPPRSGPGVVLERRRVLPVPPDRARDLRATRSSPRRSAAKAPCCSTRTGGGSCSTCTRMASSPPATSSPAGSRRRWRGRADVPCCSTRQHSAATTSPTRFPGITQGAAARTDSTGESSRSR